MAPRDKQGRSEKTRGMHHFSPPSQVEMGGSRTPRPSEPIGAYPTSVVDVLLYAMNSHRQDFVTLVLWS